LQDWILQENGSGGAPINLVATSKDQLTKAETGVTHVYTALSITPSPTFNSNKAFVPVASFTSPPSGAGGLEPEQYYFHPDHLGSSNYITNIAGEVSQHMEYFAFGETFVEEHKNSINSPYKFNGKELDEESGLYYYGARYYDPRISIWASTDPLAEEFPDTSPYAFVNNNPLRFTDPTGKASEDVIDPPKKKYKSPDISKQDGFFRKHGDYTTADKSSGLAGVVFGYNKDSKNYSTKTSVKLFNVEGKNVDGRYSKSVSAKARGIHVETKNRIGTENFNMYSNAEGSALYAEASADNGILTGETGKYGFNFGAGAEAGAAKGEISSGLTVFGIKMGGTQGACVECVGAAANFGVYYDNKKGNLVIKGSQMLGIEVGGKLGFVAELPIVKITEKIVKTFSK
jgi:RHS repeat-associated protein